MADFQTLRNFLPGRPPGLAPGSGRRIELALRDGSGDRLAARVHGGEGRGPLAVLVHGLTGCEDSFHVLQAGAALLAAGHGVVRLNLRGAPPGRALARGHYHMNRFGDLADACAGLAKEGFSGKGIALVGYSLGGALALRLAGSDACPPSLRAVVAVSAPVDLIAASARISRLRNRPYERWLTARLRAETRPVWRARGRGVRRAVQEARTIRAFDDALTASEAGFRDALDYYRACSPARTLGALRVPCLALHADDDPWIPPPEARRKGGGLTVVVTRGGGHVGFHGRGDRTPWHARATQAWLAKLS